MTSTDLLDLTTLQNLVELDDGGTGLLREMIGIFREDTPRRIQDIAAAAEAGQAEALSRASHALKGGSGALGASAMKNLAAQLEGLGRSGSTDVGPDLDRRLQDTFQACLDALDAFAADREKA